MPRQFFLDILASRIGGTIHIGVINDLVRRVAEYKSKQVEGFTRRYGVDLSPAFASDDGVAGQRLSPARNPVRSSVT
jgi:putative endonuclease